MTTELPSYACDTLEYTTNGVIGELKEIITKKILYPIKNSSTVAHIGCDITAPLRALAYLKKAKKIGRYDINQEYIHFLKITLNGLSFKEFKTNYSYYIDYIENHNLSEEAYKMRYTLLLEADISIYKRDFCSKVVPGAIYDEIICIESVEAVDTKDELCIALDNLKAMVSNTGTIRIASLLFATETALVKSKQKQQLEGILNPGYDVFEACCSKVGLKIYYHESIILQYVPNYSICDIYYIQHI